MDKRKNYYLVLDVETAGDLNAPLVYDIGFAVCDKQGNIYLQKSYIVPEIFYGEPKKMDTAYYAEKIPMYDLGITKGEWEIKRFLEIRKEITNIIETFNIKAVCAYNASFDLNALNNTVRYITGTVINYFFPYGTEIFCIMNMAAQVLFTQKSYLRKAALNKWETEKGNVKTSAEMAWRYITGDTEFEEAHTGLADVMIETQIMNRCFRQHKKMNKGINRGAWRIPQKAYKEVRG